MSIDSYLFDRANAFSNYYKAFDELPSRPDINVTIVHRGLNIHMVGTTDLYPDKEMRDTKRYGYYLAPNDIWLLTKYLNGKYVFNEFALGHEFWHDIDYGFDLIANPDNLEGELK